MRIALVSDFDGTISNDDFFYYIAEKYLTPDDLKPWYAYMQGKKWHFEALREIYAKLRVKESALQKFIRQIRIDKHFAEAAALCREQSLPLYICSAGCDYYINIVLGELMRKYQIKLITNYASYSLEHGLQLQKPDKNSWYYDEDLGVSKIKTVEMLQQLGYFVIYCGDGIPDLGAAGIADKVFARKTLLEKCRAAGIAAEELCCFAAVTDFIRKALA